MNDEERRMNVASTGLVGTESVFLDAHFEACRPEYEAMIRSVGLQPNWRVLDAACGAGSFLPLIASLVGSAGSVSAFDLAPDTVAVVERRISDGSLGKALSFLHILSVPERKRNFRASGGSDQRSSLNREDVGDECSDRYRVLGG
jgi:hypothetical protein